MNKRKLIKKLALPAGIVAAASIILLIAFIPIDNIRNQNHKDEFKKYIASFMEQNKAYVKGIAVKIKSLPVDPVMVNEIQSDYMIDHQKSDEPKKYLWISSITGDFQFGAPAADFQRLNSAFDKYQSTIKADDFYHDRNDFLVKLIDKVNDIDFTQFEVGDHRDNGWRYFKQDDDWNLIQATSSNFSAPAYDDKGKLIGEIYLKVDDKVNIEKYYRECKSELLDTLRGVVIALLVISGVFLWFLLPTWVYTDAQDRDVKNPGIWAFLTLTSLFFGLVIYLITRPNTLKSFNCPQCDGELNETRAYCPHCGYDLSNTFCQQCQYPIKPEWQFCPNCRAETKSKVHNHIEGQGTGSLEASKE
ncbi:MAG: zinc ribbon domain-containing protein [Ignavibacteriaceae bacterium]|nr:zinc ribbon domain-containing protein [Ignavibacteriaceae bacterium]